MEFRPSSLPRSTNHCLLIIAYAIIFLLLPCFTSLCFSQCSPQTGNPPPGSDFNTGGNGAGAPDSKWLIATDSINGTYKPAIIMVDLPQFYPNNTHWISFSAAGEHSGDK